MRLPGWLERLAFAPTVTAAATPLTPPSALHEASSRSSLIFDSHVRPMEEAASGGGRNPKAVSLAWDEGKAWGISLAPQTWLGMTPRERKETLLSINLANPWASNCIDTIGLYITSGGYTIEPRVENPDEKQYKKIEAFLRRVNDDWDFNQYTYDQITDDMIFGEAFTEFTMKDGEPYQLFPLDCLPMDTVHDKYGRVVKYTQQLTSTHQPQDLDPKTIIRWWNPHKRAKVDPFSPLERIQDAILLDKKMTNWMTAFFQKGAKFPYSIEGAGDQDEADRFLTWWRANYTGEKNAQTPVVTYGNAKIVPGSKGSIDIDFDKGLDRMQTIVLSAFHVPPSIACIAENGNRLTDMSDSQRKILQYIACDPRRHRFFEKFNWRLIYPYFGTDYYVSTRYADFRAEEALAKISDIHVRNGTLLIDEVRQEMGKKAYADGSGAIPVIVTTKEVTPVPRLKDLEDEQRQTAQTTLTTAKANADLAQTKAKQAKEPPPPMPPMVPPGQPDAAKKTAPPLAKAKPGDDGKEETWRAHPLRQESDADRPVVVPRNTGMMLAFLLDPLAQRLLAIAGGEPASELHITLAYLGDMQDSPALDGSYTPHTMPEPIKRVLMAVTSAARPLTGRIAGIARFTTQPDEDAPTPIVATVDVPGLVELRTELVEALEQANYFVAENHGYTPHITLAYVGQDAEMPIDDVPPLELRFDTVMLCIGDERRPFKLGGDLTPPPEENHEDSEQATKKTGDQSTASSAQQSNETQDTLGRVGHRGNAEFAIQEHGESTSLRRLADAPRDVLGSRSEALSGRDGDRRTADQRKAELAAYMAALFLAIKQRGALSAPTVATALIAYSLSDQDRESLAQRLAEVCLAAQEFAYNRDMAAVGITGRAIPSVVSGLLSWSHDQVASIAKTMQEQLSNFIKWLSPDANVADEVGPWIDRYSAWKAPQIANATWGTGAHTGSTAAIEDMVDAATDPNNPDITSTDHIRIAVVPAESSNDYCKEYAGQDYTVDEYLALGMVFPAHPGCIHSIEAYIDDSGVDVSDELGDEEL